MSIPVYILKRILVAIPTVLVVSMLGFLLMRYHIVIGPLDLPMSSGQTLHVLDRIELKNPIDPLAGYRNNPQISAAALRHEEERLGLNQPMHIQYWLWFSHVMTFDWNALLQGRILSFFQPDLGKTFTGDEVADILWDRGKNTALLNVVTIVISWLIAIPIGVYAALHWRSHLDRALTVFSAIGMACPGFVVALLLAVVVVKTGILPFGGLTSPQFETMNWAEQFLDLAKHLILPVTVLTIGSISGLQRQMRGNLLDVLGAEYVRTARAKGLPENQVIYKHAVRTAINPMITMLGFEFAALLGGAVLTETVLGFPGLGLLTYQAVTQTDTNLVMASLVLSTVMLVLGNLLADILLKLVDPRITLDS